MFESISKFGVTRRAFDNKICALYTSNPRDFTNDPYKRVDDKAFGGAPQGKVVNQQLVNELALHDGLIFVCGRYEGVDERFIERNIDLELSIGDFVVSGGELPAMLLIDSIMRQLPGVLNDKESAVQDSFMNNLLDYPHYTLPREYNGTNVPDVLLSGNHRQIELWRLQMSLWRTYQRRPDLLQSKNMTKIESGLLKEMIEKHS